MAKGAIQTGGKSAAAKAAEAAKREAEQTAKDIAAAADTPTPDSETTSEVPSTVPAGSTATMTVAEKLADNAKGHVPTVYHVPALTPAQANAAAIDDRFAKIAKANTDVLALAVECAERLQGDELQTFMVDTVAIEFQREYRPLAALKYMETALTPEQLARLPWPRSKYADIPEPPPGSNFVRAAHDVVDSHKFTSWKGTEETEATSFYRELLRGTPEGKRLFHIVDCVDMARSNAIKTPAEWSDIANGVDGNDKLAAAEQDALKGIRTLQTAFEQAGRIHIQIARFSNIRNLELTFRRDPDGVIEQHAKPVLLSHTPRITEDMDDKKKVDEFKRVARTQQDFTLSQFMGWKLTPKFIGLCNAYTLAQQDQTMGFIKKNGAKGVEEKAAATPAAVVKTPDTSATHMATASKYRVDNAGEMKQALNEVMSWYQGGNDAEQGERYKQLRESIVPGKDDESVWTMVRLFDLLAPLMATQELAMRKRAADYQAALDQAIADKAKANTPS